MNLHNEKYELLMAVDERDEFNLGLLVVELRETLICVNIVFDKFSYERLNES